MKGAQIVMEILVEQGVDVVFGFPGGTVIDIYDELYKYQDKIRHILTCHEQGAAHAADGYARATGKTGVVIATSGPGATNIVTGIATAHYDSTPLVAITGNVALNMIGRDSFQEVDITSVTIPVTKHNFMVKDIRDLADTIREAFIIANSGRPGPVLVDIPKDIQNGFAGFTNKEVSPLKPTLSPTETELDKAAELISQSEKPYVCVGGGVILSNACKEALMFAKRIDSPLGATMMGLSAVPWDYDGFTGMLGMHGNYTSTWTINEADLIIALGTRFSDRVTGNKAEFAKQAKILHIDIDDAEIGKNIGVFMSLSGDVKSILCSLSEKIPQLEKSEWNKQVTDVKLKTASAAVKDNGMPRPWDVIRKVWEKAGDDAVVATDVGQHQMWTSQYYRFSKPRTYLTSGGLGTMGFGMGAAIGGCIGRNKRTVLFTGDGSFHMNLNELATMVTYKLPVVIVIMNNRALGMVKQWQDLFYEKRFSNTIIERKTDYVKLAEAFGAKGLVLSCPTEIDAVIDEAFKETKGPVVIDCLIDPKELVLPMIPAGGSIKNIITERTE